MTNSLLSCTVCKQSFRGRTTLNNHVRREHQSLVKVKFQNGRVVEIKRGGDNAFKCGCDKLFKHPLSLKKHAKECNGESTSVDNGSIDEDISGEEEDLDASESSSELDDNRMDDIPADCIGTMSRRFN